MSEKVRNLPEIKVKKLINGVKLPKFATSGSAGADVYSQEDKTLEPGERYIFGLGFSCAVPEDYALLVCSRSGMSLRGLIVANQPGIIDSDYREQIGVILWNTTNSPVTIHDGDRIAQLMLVPAYPFCMEIVDELDETSRKGGFGSTGKG